MSDYFHFIRPGQSADANQIAGIVGARRHDMEDLVHDAVNLASSATQFFRGIFPVVTPHFFWDYGTPLPWLEDCPNSNSKEHPSSAIAMLRDATKVAERLESIADVDPDAEPQWGLTYFSDALTVSDQSEMQGLAVEVMLAVENFLASLQSGSVTQAMRWLSVAYKDLIECSSHAHEILVGIPPSVGDADWAWWPPTSPGDGPRAVSGS
jgi:hypothetical protein